MSGSPAPPGRVRLVALTPESRAALGPRRRRSNGSPIGSAESPAQRIDRDDAGYVLVDRGSTCGTRVEGEIAGGDTRGGTIALHDGDVIIVGTSNSPYTFKFRVG